MVELSLYDLYRWCLVFYEKPETRTRSRARETTKIFSFFALVSLAARVDKWNELWRNAGACFRLNRRPTASVENNNQGSFLPSTSLGTGSLVGIRRKKAGERSEEDGGGGRGKGEGESRRACRKTIVTAIPPPCN